MPYPGGGLSEPGSTMLVTFELLGREYAAINGGPRFPLTGAVPFEVVCNTLRERAYGCAAAPGVCLTGRAELLHHDPGRRSLG